MKIIAVVIIIAGTLSIILSVLFKLTHWPGVNTLFGIGLILFIAGLFYFNKVSE